MVYGLLGYLFYWKLGEKLSWWIGCRMVGGLDLWVDLFVELGWVNGFWLWWNVCLYGGIFKKVIIYLFGFVIKWFLFFVVEWS